MPPVRSKNQMLLLTPIGTEHRQLEGQKNEGKRERASGTVRKKPNETAMASRIPDEVLASFTESTSAPGMTSAEPDQIISTGRQLRFLYYLACPGTSANTFKFGSMPNVEACAGDDIAANIPLSLK